jgi:hypothetical protein
MQNDIYNKKFFCLKFSTNFGEIAKMAYNKTLEAIHHLYQDYKSKIDLPVNLINIS